jgi:hypothetical protein
MFQCLGQTLTSAWRSLNRVQVAKAEVEYAAVLQPAVAIENSALNQNNLASPPEGVIYRSYYFSRDQRVAMRVERDPTLENNCVSPHRMTASLNSDRILLAEYE